MEVTFGKCMGKMQSCLFSQLVWSGLMRKFLKAIKLRHQFVVMLKYNFYYPGDTRSMWFGEIGTFWAKKITQEKSTKFVKIFELYQIFIHNFLSQNVPINPNHILPTHTKAFLSLLPILIFVSENWFYFFFIIFWHASIPPSCWMPFCRH